jgi:CHAD domain-containing protein
MENEPVPMPDGTLVRDRVRKLALRRLNRMMRLEPRVLRGDDPDAIHDFRVASRRLQSALDFLMGSPRAAEIRKARRKIKRCRKACSAVRNCDVFIQHIEKALTRTRGPRREAWEAVLDYVRERRRKAHARASKKLGKLNFAQVYTRLRTHLESDTLPPGAEPDSVFPEGSAGGDAQLHNGNFERLNQARANLEKYFAGAQGSSDVQAIHRARIATKKLRYLIEILDDLGVQSSRPVLTRLRELQQHLGDWHDLEVAEQMMEDMITQPGFLRERLDLAMQVLRLIAQTRKTKSRLLARAWEWTPAGAGDETPAQWASFSLKCGINN